MKAVNFQAVGASYREDYQMNAVAPIPHTILHNPVTREVFVLDTVRLTHAMQDNANLRPRSAPKPSRERY